MNITLLKMLYRSLILIFAALAFSFHLPSIEQSEKENISISIEMVDLPFSISRADLYAAKNIKSLNRIYKKEWIKEFISVDVTGVKDGQSMTVSGGSDQFNSNQLAFLKEADLTKSISIKITYIPDNTLKNNDPKDYEFKINVRPDKNATYKKGESELQKYLETNVLSKIPESTFTGYKLAAVTFTVDHNGHIINPKIAYSSEDEKVDEAMYQAICNLEEWAPAEYQGNIKASQNFALAVGNMESCVINLLNLRSGGNFELTEE